jgi:hypothetical protein
MGENFAAMAPPGYTEPKDTNEARERLSDLKMACLKIESQLASRNRESRGRRMDAESFWEWRHAAIHAMNQKKAEILLLKDWISASRIRGDDSPVVVTKASTLVSQKRKLREQVRESYAWLFKYISALEKKVSDLLEVNKNLRHALDEYEGSPDMEPELEEE